MPKFSRYVVVVVVVTAAPRTLWRRLRGRPKRWPRNRRKRRIKVEGRVGREVSCNKNRFAPEVYGSEIGRMRRTLEYVMDRFVVSEAMWASGRVRSTNFVLVTTEFRTEAGSELSEGGTVTSRKVGLGLINPRSWNGD